MSRKVHALGFRLGTSQPWSTQLQTYNNLSSAYLVLVIKKYQAINFLRRILARRHLILSYTEWSFKDFMIHCESFYTPYHTLKYYQVKWVRRSKDIQENSNLFKVIDPCILQSWFNTCLIIRFYRVHWLHNPKSLAFWISLKLKQYKSIKFITKQLKKDLSRSKNWIYTTKYFFYGPTKFYLKGIKIVCCGRLRGKRQRMSNSIIKQIGIMPLQELNAFVEYEKTNVYTRFGKIGIHVYYYYN